MPIYEFRCDDCDTVSEVLMKRGAAAPPCTDCGSEKVTKEFSVFAMSSPECSSERTCESLDGGPPMSCPNAGKCRLGA
ncbi:MAG TPA: zinc ribbon domain-containing protein [Armatimonadota bacterium]|nr:zinc ribbon domain-containing protein [Armatimonadota bacterium]